MGQSKLVIELCDDGTIRTDARAMAGDDKQILAELEELAREAGGELVVEKHEPGRHVHHHERTDERQRTKT